MRRRGQCSGVAGDAGAFRSAEDVDIRRVGEAVPYCATAAEFRVHVDPQSRPSHTPGNAGRLRSEEHTSELQSLMRISYAVFCLKKKKSHYTWRKSNTPHYE